ncbi:protein of unknown function [Candidatus Filomicrobium marinum]|nr:protein of unknown function [Candidatus Filomicrobium marinum]
MTIRKIDMLGINNIYIKETML